MPFNISFFRLPKAPEGTEPSKLIDVCEMRGVVGAAVLKCLEGPFSLVGVPSCKDQSTLTINNNGNSGRNLALKQPISIF